jgi:Family of unknown function (DUF5995)
MRSVRRLLTAAGLAIAATVAASTIGVGQDVEEREYMRAENIDEVIAHLAAIVGGASANGSRAGYFASLYRQVTVEIRASIHAGEFDDGERMSRFDAHFGNRYFDAFDSWHRDRSGPTCWREAFTLVEDDTAIIVQHLLMGVNAHINLDLAVAAAQTSPGGQIYALERDFFLVNDILVRVLMKIQEALGEISPFMGLLDRFGGRNDEQILDFSIRKSRQEAWQFAVLLAFQTGKDWDDTIERMDTRSALLARLIARPALPIRPALQLIRATESSDVAAVIAHLDRAMES